MENESKVLYGISNLHIAKITETAEGITYGAPFALPGAVGLAFNPSGETNPFYADNRIYFNSTANQGYTGDLVVAKTPEKVYTDILGQLKDKNGAIIENADDKTARFAIMGELEGDMNKTRFVFYDCTTTRPSRDNSTIENSKTPTTDSLSLTMSPRSTDREVRAFLPYSEENKVVYNKFFESVYEKDTTTSI